MDTKDVEIGVKWSQPSEDVESGVSERHHGRSGIATKWLALSIVAFLMFWCYAPMTNWIHASSANRLYSMKRLTNV